MSKRNARPVYIPEHGVTSASHAARMVRDVRRASLVLMGLLEAGSDEAALLAAVLLAGPHGAALAVAA